MTAVPRREVISGQPTKLSPLHHKHVSLGALMVEREGWMIPEKYSDPEEEVALALSAAGLSDVSVDAKVDVKGTQVEDFLRDLLKTEKMPSIPGAVAVRPPSSESGLAVKYACRLTRDRALLVLDGPRILSERKPFSVDILRTARHAFLTNVSSTLAGVTLCGPSSREIIRGLTRLDVSERAFPSPACSETGLAGVHCLVIRSDAPGSGLLSFHIYFGRECAEFVWDALTLAGRRVGLTPLGTTAIARVQGGERTPNAGHGGEGRQS
jgi:sarcosine oxidase, subunit alpha